MSSHGELELMGEMSHGAAELMPYDSDSDIEPKKKKSKKGKKKRKRKDKDEDSSEDEGWAASVSAVPHDDDDDDISSKKKKGKKRKTDESDEEIDETEEKKSTLKRTVSIAAPPTAPSNMSRSKLIAQLEKRGLSTKGMRKALVKRLEKDIKEREQEKSKNDPAKMSIRELREKCDELGLETKGAKRVMIHRLRTELNRLSGKSTATFDASLLTVTQLKKWLDKKSITYDRNKNKAYYVNLVENAVEEEDEDKKENDVKAMSTSDLINWLEEHGVTLPKKKKKRQYYIDLVEANMGEDAGLLFKEDEILYHKKLFFGQRFVVVQSDLSKCNAEAVIHPTNEVLVLGGGVGQALARASGPKFKAGVKNYIRDNGKLKVTECCITLGQELPCTNVIHTYSPVYSKTNIEKSRKQLDDSIHAIMELAAKEKLKSIALPSIGSGVNGYPPDVAAETILKSIQDYFVTKGVDNDIKEVYFVLYDEASVDVYSESLVNL